MDNVELFQRVGLAVAIGAAVGVERHWRERDEPEGARTAGIRTFTMIGMLGGVAGLIERSLIERSLGAASAYPGIVTIGFLLAVAAVMALFELREAIAQHSFSATSVIAAILTFGLGVLAVTGDMVPASAAGATLVAILASRDFLHGAIRRLQWVELRSAVILLAMTFVLLPVIPSDPVGPFGGISPRSLVLLVITLASISFAGYIAVRMLGPSRGDMVAGAIGGIVSSTGTTIAFARRSREGANPISLAAGAVSAGAVSLARTAFLVGTLAASLLPALLLPVCVAAVLMLAYALFLSFRQQVATERQPPGNPFELVAVAKMAALLAGVAFLARAATQYFGDTGLIAASAISALADVDAVTVTVAGMRPALDAGLAARAIGAAVLANMAAKAVYATIFGSRPFAIHLWAATLLSTVAGLAAESLQAWISG
ncbi:MgtC/SapB family protein [Rhizobium puerariae]|uniref:MgtC/SapB family protein n=1 Tax=Rhizobium puerariae TaxID=1585791 RepID=A0ABV6ARL8_9HYPH